MNHIKTSKQQRLAMESLEGRRLLSADGLPMPIVSFEPAVTSTLMATSNGQIQMGELLDLDQNGELDVAAASSRGGATNPLQMSFFTQSNGSYTRGEPDGLEGRYFVDIVKGDMNADGWVDVAVATNDGVYSYLNQGTDGEGNWLGMQQTQQITYAATSIDLADLNNDGLADLVLGSERSMDVRLASSGNAGTFPSGIRYSPGDGPKQVTTGDVNGDGNIDVVVAMAQAGTAVVLTNDGDGFLANSQTITDVIPSNTIELLDVNADQQLDLVVGGSNQYHANVILFIADAGGGFSQGGVGYETVGAPLNVVMGDVDGDGTQDMIVSHDGTFHHPITNNGGGGISVMMGAADGQYQPPVRLTSPGATGLATYDRAGKATIVGLRQWNNEITELSWLEQSFFQSATDYSEELTTEFTQRGAEFADFNADGLTDTVVMEWSNTAKLTVFFAEGDDTYAELPLEFPENLFIHELLIGDFNGDGVDDLAARTQLGQSTGYRTWISNADGTFANPIASVLPASFQHRQILDIDGDGRDDLIGIEAEGIRTSIVVATANPNGSWTANPAKFDLKNRFVHQFSIQDVDGDSNRDLVATSFQGTEVVWGTANGTFDSSVAVGLETSFSAVGDFNADGFIDIAGGGFGESSISIAFGNANRSFTVQQNVPLSEALSQVQGMQPIDVIPGQPDEIVLLRNDSFYLLTADGNGGFLVTDFELGFFPARVFTQDANHDGIEDIIVSQGKNFISGSPTTYLAMIPGIENGPGGSELAFADSIVAAIPFVDGSIQRVQSNGTTTQFYIEHRGGFGIVSATPDDSLLGDFDEDGQISSADLDLLCRISQQASHTDAEILRFDQNADQAIDAQDVDSWLADVAQTVRGDADLDGDVDFADFLTLSAVFGSSDSPAWSDGDFDCNGEVGFADFLMLSSNFGTGG